MEDIPNYWISLWFIEVLENVKFSDRMTRIGAS
jgi:hypothetical protein